MRRATGLLCLLGSGGGISIHALREEGDKKPLDGDIIGVSFLSTPSARRATGRAAPHLSPTAYFYPRPPRGGRPALPVAGCGCQAYFYPRPPRGGRLAGFVFHGADVKFLSTPSARRATAKTETKSLFSYKLYNILHEFRRALIYSGSKNYPNHAKRLKNLVRRCRKDAENSPFAPGRKTQNNSRPSCSKGG